MPHLTAIYHHILCVLGRHEWRVMKLFGEWEMIHFEDGEKSKYCLWCPKMK